MARPLLFKPKYGIKIEEVAMKILIATLNSKYIHTNLAIRYFYKILKNKKYNVHIKEFTINEYINDIVQSITDINPDVIAFSTYIWNIEMTLKISNNIKKINPNIQIILGGPEVSFDAEKILKENNYINSIIKGEGEEILVKVIEDIKNKLKKNIYNRKSGREYRKNT